MLKITICRNVFGTTKFLENETTVNSARFNECHGHVDLRNDASSSWVRCVLAEQAIVRHVNFEQIKCVLLGSPGFVKDDFFNFLNLEAVRREERVRAE